MARTRPNPCQATTLWREKHARPAKFKLPGCALEIVAMGDNSEMAESRNQHYIPQGYLRGFGWKRGKHHMVPAYMRFSPGFAVKSTEVYFPLTKHSLLVGRWDDEEKTISPANQPFVGVMNKQMVDHSHGLALSSDRKMLYHDRLLRLQWDDKMIGKLST